MSVIFQFFSFLLFQIETRVKREIVVTDDGEIIEDSGPQVTTDTTEESRTEEQENTEVSAIF